MARLRKHVQARDAPLPAATPRPPGRRTAARGRPRPAASRGHAQGVPSRHATVLRGARRPRPPPSGHSAALAGLRRAWRSWPPSAFSPHDPKAAESHRARLRAPRRSGARPAALGRLAMGRVPLDSAALAVAHPALEAHGHGFAEDAAVEPREVRDGLAAEVAAADARSSAHPAGRRRRAFSGLRRPREHPRDPPVGVKQLHRQVGARRLGRLQGRHFGHPDGLRRRKVNSTTCAPAPPLVPPGARRSPRGPRSSPAPAASRSGVAERPPPPPPPRGVGTPQRPCPWWTPTPLRGGHTAAAVGVNADTAASARMAMRRRQAPGGP